MYFLIHLRAAWFCHLEKKSKLHEGCCYVWHWWRHCGHFVSFALFSKTSNCSSQKRILNQSTSQHKTKTAPPVFLTRDKHSLFVQHARKNVNGSQTHQFLHNICNSCLTIVAGMKVISKHNVGEAFCFLKKHPCQKVNDIVTNKAVNHGFSHRMGLLQINTCQLWDTVYPRAMPLTPLTTAARDLNQI